MKYRKNQTGMLLIEVMVAVLLFVVGIMGMVRAMGISQVAQADAQNRSEASNFASVIVQRMRVMADSTSAASYKTSLESFRHQVGGTNCAFTGGASTNTAVSSWVDEVMTGSGHLPGSTAAMQQILVDTDATGYNKVTVTVCWQGPNDLQPRRHIFSAYVNQNFS